MDIEEEGNPLSPREEEVIEALLKKHCLQSLFNEWAQLKDDENIDGNEKLAAAKAFVEKVTKSIKEIKMTEVKVLKDLMQVSSRTINHGELQSIIDDRSGLDLPHGLDSKKEREGH